MTPEQIETAFEHIVELMEIAFDEAASLRAALAEMRNVITDDLSADMMLHNTYWRLEGCIADTLRGAKDFMPEHLQRLRDQTPDPDRLREDRQDRETNQ